MTDFELISAILTKRYSWMHALETYDAPLSRLKIIKICNEDIIFTFDSRNGKLLRVKRKEVE